MSEGADSRLRQWWFIALCLGIVLINYPFLQIFNRGVFLFGFPVLFLYFMLGWAASIAVIFLHSRTLGRTPDKGG